MRPRPQGGETPVSIAHAILLNKTRVRIFETLMFTGYSPLR